MRKKKIQVGDKFFNWEVQEFLENKRVRCKCTACNDTIKDHLRGVLLGGKSKSCGCLFKSLSQETWSKKDTKQGRVKVDDVINNWKVLEITEKYFRCLCIACNVSIRDLLKACLVSGETKSCGCISSQIRKRTILERFGEAGLHCEEVERKRETTCLEKYGAQSVIQSDHFKEVSKQTIRSKYGVDRIWDNKEVASKLIEARKASSLEKYQVDNPSKRPEVRRRVLDTLKERYNDTNLQQIGDKKRRDTNLERYGVELPFQSKAVRDKAKSAVVEKYQVDNVRKADVVKEKIQQTRMDNDNLHTLKDGTPLVIYCREKGVPWNYAYVVYHKQGEEAFLDYCNHYDGPRVYFTTERALINLLLKDFPEIQKYDRQPVEFKINRRPDFRLEKNGKVLYINTDGLYDHSDLGRRGLSKDYHNELNRNFKENGQTIYQFREDELRGKPEIVRSIILNYFGESASFQARKCQFKKVKAEVAREFFKQNHLMGELKSSTAYGLFIKEELVCCISVRQKGSVIEVSRFCNKMNTRVVGGLGRLLSKIKELYEAREIVSWCDLRYGDGHGYLKVGFALEKVTQGWNWTDSVNTFNRLRCKAGKGLTEKQRAEQLGWARIYDAGQAKYVMKLK